AAPPEASAPCLEEPRKACPSTPSSVCTVTTPRSLWPPKAPVPVRHASLFQLNMVTLTSVIFTSNLLITRVLALPIRGHDSRHTGYATRGARSVRCSGERKRRHHPLGKQPDCTYDLPMLQTATAAGEGTLAC